MDLNADPLGLLLLSNVKYLNDRSAEDLDKMDCVQLKSLRSQGATRAVHRCVLEVGSPMFIHHIRKMRLLRAKHAEQWSNIIELDVSIEIMDIILEYLYTRKPIHITKKLAIEIYAAAKRFDLDEIEAEVEQFCLSNVMSCYRDDTFWVTASPADLKVFMDIFGNVKLNSLGKSMLMERVKKWSRNDPEKSLTASTIIDKLRTTSVVKKRLVAARRDTMAILAKPRIENQETESFVIVSMPSVVKIGSGTSSEVPGVFKGNNVILNNLMFTAFESKVGVYDLTLSKLVRELGECNGDTICGISVFCDAVFFYTERRLYVLDGEGANLTEIGHWFEDIYYNLTVLEYDANEVTVAVQVRCTSEVRILTFVKDSSTAISNTKRLTLPPKMLLKGSYEGLIYACTPHWEAPPCYYAVFRDDIELKYRRIVDCDIIHDCSMDNGLLCLNTKEADGADYVNVINLNTETVVFRKSCSELGLACVSCSMLVIKKRRDFEQRIMVVEKYPAFRRRDVIVKKVP